MRKGFEPPVRANVHLFSRQAPSTTRTPHRLGRVEVVNHEADPAGDEDQDAGDDLTHEGDGLLDDVDDGEDGEDQADEVNDGTHGCVC